MERARGRVTAVAAGLGFLALLAAFWFVSGYFGVRGQLGEHAPSAVLSFAWLLAPYWGFGFGLGDWLRERLHRPAAQLLAPALLVVAYPIYTIPRGQFQPTMCLALLAVVLGVAAILSRAESPRSGWHDWLVLAILGISVDLHFFDQAWPGRGLSGMAKLLFVDAGLYGYRVVRPLEGIGFDFRARWRDLTVGLREFLFFTPIALALGLAMGFLHVHMTLASPLWFASGWLFTLFFVAMPEELFFRGLLLNMLEQHVGTRRALWITAVLFGLAHFNKRAAYFNWRYVILAAIAGVFYGRAWLAQRRLLASSIAHATVDTVWSIWLR